MKKSSSSDIKTKSLNSPEGFFTSTLNLIKTQPWVPIRMSSRLYQPTALGTNGTMSSACTQLTLSSGSFSSQANMRSILSKILRRVHIKVRAVKNTNLFVEILFAGDGTVEESRSLDRRLGGRVLEGLALAVVGHETRPALLQSGPLDQVNTKADPMGKSARLS